MKRKLSLTFTILFVVFLLAVFVNAWLNPYRHSEETGRTEVTQSTIIQAPVEKVFAYMGNSGNAARWSVFVNHITPLNSSERADGSVGSKRRCYTRADETGASWDKEILLVDAPKMRRLNIYGIRNFGMSSDHLLTEQRYLPLGDTACLLTLSLFLDEPAAGIADEIKMNIAAFKAYPIFTRNLENIKKLVENETLHD